MRAVVNLRDPTLRTGQCGEGQLSSASTSPKRSLQCEHAHCPSLHAKTSQSTAMMAELGAKLQAALAGGCGLLLGIVLAACMCWRARGGRQQAQRQKRTSLSSLEDTESGNGPGRSHSSRTTCAHPPVPLASVSAEGLGVCTLLACCAPFVSGQGLRPDLSPARVHVRPPETEVVKSRPRESSGPGFESAQPHRVHLSGHPTWRSQTGQCTQSRSFRVVSLLGPCGGPNKQRSPPVPVLGRRGRCPKAPLGARV